LLGVSKPLSRDCLGKDEYKYYNVSNEAIKYLLVIICLPTSQEQLTLLGGIVMWSRQIERIKSALMLWGGSSGVVDMNLFIYLFP
jgi:hypothetical protein